VKQANTLRLSVLALIVVANAGFILGIELLIEFVVFVPGLLFAVVVGPILFEHKGHRRLLTFILGLAVASYLIVAATFSLSRVLEDATSDHSLFSFGVTAAFFGGLGAVFFCLWLGLLNLTGLLQVRAAFVFFAVGAMSQTIAFLIGSQFDSFLVVLCASLWWGSIFELLVRVDDSWQPANLPPNKALQTDKGNLS
jgi:hypothetical protein